MLTELVRLWTGAVTAGQRQPQLGCWTTKTTKEKAGRQGLIGICSVAHPFDHSFGNSFCEALLPQNVLMVLVTIGPGLG